MNHWKWNMVHTRMINWVQSILIDGPQPMLLKYAGNFFEQIVEFLSLECCWHDICPSSPCQMMSGIKYLQWWLWTGELSLSFSTLCRSRLKLKKFTFLIHQLICIFVWILQFNVNLTAACCLLWYFTQFPSGSLWPSRWCDDCSLFYISSLEKW